MRKLLTEFIVLNLIIIFSSVALTTGITESIIIPHYEKRFKEIEERAKSEIQFEAVSKGFGEFEIKNGEVIFSWKE